MAYSNPPMPRRQALSARFPVDEDIFRILWGNILKKPVEKFYQSLPMCYMM